MSTGQRRDLRLLLRSEELLQACPSCQPTPPHPIGQPLPHLLPLTLPLSLHPPRCAAILPPPQTQFLFYLLTCLPHRDCHYLITSEHFSLLLYIPDPCSLLQTRKCFSFDFTQFLECTVCGIQWSLTEQKRQGKDLKQLHVFSSMLGFMHSLSGVNTSRSFIRANHLNGRPTLRILALTSVPSTSVLYILYQQSDACL